MSNDTRALCVGKHVLFDSTEPADHELAAQFCAVCPLAAACADRLAETIAAASMIGHPEGTWAGQLVRDPGRDEARRLGAIDRAERIAREDAMFTDDEARRAHAAYSAGDRDEWARVGHRTYDRRRKRRLHLAARSAA